jgi:uncharacterized membrane protein
VTPARKSGSGLEPHLAATIAYLGGALTGIILLLLEKDDRYVRFHAMQSTITFLGVLVLHFVLMGMPVIGWSLYHLFVLAVAALWVFLMVKAFYGKMYKLPYIGDLAERQVR